MKYMILRTSVKYHYELLCTYGHGRWLREGMVCFLFVGCFVFAYPCIEISIGVEKR